MALSHSRYDYKIGIVCALSLERTAVESMLDSDHDSQPDEPGDNNIYSFGSIGEHNVVVASLGEGDYGTVSAGEVVNDMRRSFQAIKFGLMVGIAGGVPRPEVKGNDVRLGDVVVGCENGVPSVINYRLGKETLTGFDIRSELAEPPQAIQRAISALQTQHKRLGPTYLVHLQNLFQRNPRLDRVQVSEDYYNQPEAPDCLFKADKPHLPNAKDCDACKESGENTIARAQRFLREPPDGVQNAKFVKLRDDGFADYPAVHYGTLASADTLMKNGEVRDKIYKEVKSQRKAEVLCFEMEAAGIIKGWPCLIIRGICDYSDSHKNDMWQNFAAATAAAYAKDLLLRISPDKVSSAPRANELIEESM
jgi:nucleoside phosphorylase